ncbi:transposable element Tcb2 transposase [Trichonephila clavipes]|nr:transposable element Tcb2 transposase [Trichonephila clavipes]
MAYLNILQDNLKESADKLGLGSNFIFQQDNDPKHTAFVAEEWLLYHCRNQLNTLPQSPDLNVIDHLCSHLERAVQKHQITSKEQLKLVLQEEWLNIAPESTRHLVESMPRRLEAVISTKVESSTITIDTYGQEWKVLTISLCFPTPSLQSKQSQRLTVQTLKDLQVSLLQVKKTTPRFLQASTSSQHGHFEQREFSSGVTYSPESRRKIIVHFILKGSDSLRFNSLLACVLHAKSLGSSQHVHLRSSNSPSAVTSKVQHMIGVFFVEAHAPEVLSTEKA